MREEQVRQDMARDVAEQIADVLGPTRWPDMPHTSDTLFGAAWSNFPSLANDYASHVRITARGSGLVCIGQTEPTSDSEAIRMDADDVRRFTLAANEFVWVKTAVSDKTAGGTVELWRESA